MSGETLQNMTCKELRTIAKDYDVAGRWDMSKEELIEAILSSISIKEIADTCAADSDVTDVSESLDECVAESASECAESDCKEEYNPSNKMHYIENANIGMLVAFKLPNGKVKSAKIEKKSSNRRVFKLVTAYGAEFIVPYDDVVWVRTGGRWPRGVYCMLKGIVSEVESHEDKPV